MTVSEGNCADPVQFANIVDDIVNDLRDKPTFVSDAGGDVKQVSDVISDKKMRYVTRKKMNVSDDGRTSTFDKNEAVCVDGCDGVLPAQDVRILQTDGLSILFGEIVRR